MNTEPSSRQFREPNCKGKQEENFSCEQTAKLQAFRKFTHELHNKEFNAKCRTRFHQNKAIRKSVGLLKIGQVGCRHVLMMSYRQNCSAKNTCEIRLCYCLSVLDFRLFFLFFKKLIFQDKFNWPTRQNPGTNRTRVSFSKAQTMARSSRFLREVRRQSREQHGFSFR